MYVYCYSPMSNEFHDNNFQHNAVAVSNHEGLDL